MKRYTQNDSKVGFWQGSGANFCVWSERPLLDSKARVKTKNLQQADAAKNQVLNYFVYMSLQ